MYKRNIAGQVLRIRILLSKYVEEEYFWATLQMQDISGLVNRSSLLTACVQKHGIAVHVCRIRILQGKFAEAEYFWAIAPKQDISVVCGSRILPCVYAGIGCCCSSA